MVFPPLKSLQDIPRKGEKQHTGGERGWGTSTGSSGKGPASPGARQDAQG